MDITKKSKGFLIEYTNREIFCHSPLLLPGISLMDDWILAILYAFTLIYIFVGITIVSDIFMESIEVITA